MQLKDSCNFAEKENKCLDEMTGLYNREKALSVLEEYLGARERVSIILLDIDNFESMNARFGHAFGDEVIMSISGVLKDAANNRGFAARVGDDDFLLCICDMESDNELRAVIQSIYFHFKRAFMEKDHQFSLTMGIAEYPNNTGNCEVLIEKAEKALKIGKEKGKNRYIFYKEFVHGEISK